MRKQLLQELMLISEEEKSTSQDRETSHISLREKN